MSAFKNTSICILSVLFIAISSVFNQENFDSSQGEDASYVEGKRQFEKLSLKAQSYGSCWKSAVHDLRVNCKHLDHDIQSRLAVSFANCFLQHAGSKTWPCAKDISLSVCLETADDRFFSTYTEFFTHTQSICYFLQHQAWQEQTEDTIKRLSSSSERVSQQLHKSSKSQTTMLHLQQIALGKQHELINSSEVGLKHLNHELEKSRDNVKNIFDEFKSTTDEQRMLIFGVFDRIKKLEALVMGEFTGFYTFIYYLGAVFLSYLLTATPRTANARLYLIVLFTINAVLERIVVSYNIEAESEKQVLLDTDGPIYQRIWLCRKVFCFLGCSALLISSYRYKDYNIINNRLLMNIEQQNLEMRNVLRNIGLDSNLSSPIGKEVLSAPDDGTKEIQCPGTSPLIQSITERLINSREDVSKVEGPSNVLQPVLMVDNHNGIDAIVRKKAVKRKPKTKETPSEDSLNGSMRNNFSLDMSPQESPSGRYSLRPRSRLSTPMRFEFSDKSASPSSIAKQIKSAEKVTAKNRQSIQRLLKSEDKA